MTDLTLLVHVGPHRTGSTFLQGALAQRRRELQQQDVVYPKVGTEYGGAHHNIAWLVAGRTIRGTTAEAVTAGLQLLTAERPGRILLSSEEFSRLTAEDIPHIRDLFPGAHFKVVYVQRSGVRFAVSLWQNMVQHGSVVPLGRATREALAKQYRYDPFDHARNQAKWRATLDDPVTVIDYASARSSTDGLAGAFARALEITISGASGSANESVPRDVIELIRAANLHAQAIGRISRLVPRHVVMRTLRGRPGRQLRQATTRLVDELSVEVPSATRTSWTEEDGSGGPSIPFVPNRQLYDALTELRLEGWRQITHGIENAPPDLHGDEAPGIVRRIAARLAH